MCLNCGFLKIQSRNRLREEIKITQIQPRFVLKLTIHFKFGVTQTWTGDFLNSNWESDLEEKIKIA